MSEAAELRGAPGMNDEGCGDAADHRGSHAHEVHSLPWLFDRGQKIGRFFLGWIGFTSEQGLVDEQIARCDQPTITGHDVAAFSSTTSPGTSRSTGTSWTFPSRSTSALSPTDRRKASTVFSALACCTTSSTTL